MSLFVDIKKNMGAFSLDVSFETNGGVTGLLGASGCGKSMTLKCIAGIEKPDSGKIVLNGVTLFDSDSRINLPPQKRKVGYLFQNYALFVNMTVRKNILCGLKLEKDKQKKKETVNEMINFMQLNGLENHRPSQLSGGQQQRTALARILVSSPNLLMLDEPFSALDSYLRGQLQIQTQKLLKDFGKDVLFVTHSRNEAYRLCKNIALVSDGSILTLKETKALFADPESIEAALLTGVKNIVPAKKHSEYEAFVPEWGIAFKTAKPVRDDLEAVAIRAHYFNPKIVHNRFPVTFTNIMEEPFEYICQFRYDCQSDESQDVWWRIPKDKKISPMPAELGIAPVNVLLLYPKN